MQAGLGLGILGATALGGIFAATVYFQPVPRDEETLCQKLGSHSTIAAEAAHHVIVVDKSDKWNQAQAARLRNVVVGVRDHLGVNEKMSIFVFASTVEQGFAPAFSRCNPGRGSDTTILISNPRKWEKRFVASFGEPLDGVLNALTLPTTGPSSPILEVLIDLTNRQELINPEMPRRIVLVSDMIQNSDAYSLFPSIVTQPVVPIPNRPPAVGGPLVPAPLVLPSAPGSATVQPPVPPKPVTKKVEPRKLKGDEIVKLVEKKGGLGNLRKFRIEVYQIRGTYQEPRLALAREFWDLLASQYGSKIEWKVL
jgi:hypothetical protein